MRRLSVFAALLVLLSLVVLQRQTATSGLDKPATRIVVPSLAADVSAQAQTRGYRMGWFPATARADRGIHPEDDARGCETFRCSPYST
ncbi:hypothetical protein [Candidatus Amarobacter glycogenicus]|uniref:hypothetical protein n=1 Tax=Candidatus Amarobacter glycogenicus TaxID=3140699 RepID=UPI002A0BE81D|nr:hypothetical protein [Dehalococcoidia bacterium]